jgi:antirestriction protein ArdC
LVTKDFVPSVSNASLHWDGSTYYSTLFHELVHSTGHESRLNSSFGAHFGDELYSKEELVAGQGLTLSLVQEN